MSDSVWHNVSHVIVSARRIVLVLRKKDAKSAKAKRKKAGHYKSRELTARLIPEDWQKIDKIQLSWSARHLREIFRETNNAPCPHDEMSKRFIAKLPRHSKTANMRQGAVGALNTGFRKARLPYRLLADPKKRYQTESRRNKPYRIYKLKK